MFVVWFDNFNFECRADFYIVFFKPLARLECYLTSMMLEVLTDRNTYLSVAKYTIIRFLDVRENFDMMYKRYFLSVDRLRLVCRFGILFSSVMRVYGQSNISNDSMTSEGIADLRSR